MEKIGIICEYNPFHNGHIYHLNYIKKKYKNSLIFLVMSGNFCQRGDLSVINTFDKAKIALEAGIDVVIELPYFYATQAADIFAFGALKILNEIGVNRIVFGSESNDPKKLKSYAQKQLTEEYNLKVKNYLKDGLSYPEATAISLDDKLFNQPNDILGLAYTKEIIKNNYPIEIETIKRTNNYNELNLNSEISSAMAIRNNLEKGIDISKYVPDYALKYIKNININNYYKYLQYRIINEKKDILKYHLVDEKLVQRILNKINDSNNFEELILNLKAKNYTYNFLKRVLINILLGITKEDIDNKKDYIRLLGLSKQGKEYFNSIKNNLNIPVITSITNDKDNLLYLNTKIINTLALEDKDYLNDLKSHTIIKD